MAGCTVPRPCQQVNPARLWSNSSSHIAKRMARRYAGRLIPFIGAPIGAIQNGNSTKQLGRRSLDYYARP